MIGVANRCPLILGLRLQYSKKKKAARIRAARVLQFLLVRSGAQFLQSTTAA
jgi:hypothetical protein